VRGKRGFGSIKVRHFQYVIVGAGMAGGEALRTLVRRTDPGEILLVGAEPYLPYDRPSLSKEYLAVSGTVAWLNDPDRLEKAGVVTSLGTPCSASTRMHTDCTC
jgi:NADPH-dependent 2,4-dienoyl-CoA reductase/sulfur reductase-like enzyme